MSANKNRSEQTGPVMTMSFENASYALNAFLYFHKYMPEHLRTGLDKKFLEKLNSCAIDKSPYSCCMSADIKQSVSSDYIAEQCLEPLAAKDRLALILTTCHSVVTDPVESNKEVRTYFASKIPYFFLDDKAYAQHQCDTKLHISVEKPKSHFFRKNKDDIHIVATKTEEFLKGSDLVDLVHDEDISKEKGIVLKGHHTLSEYFGLINQTESRMEASWDSRNLKVSSLKRTLKAA